MRNVERIRVVACGPVLVCVIVCGSVLRCAYACLVFVVDKPSLQALRAETMVERFTARMHVTLRV